MGSAKREQLSDQQVEPASERSETTWIARLGVRSYLFLFLFAAAAIPTLSLGVIHSERVAAAALQRSERQTMAAAEALGEQVDITLTGYVRGVEAFSAQIGRAGGLTPSAMRAALPAHVETYPAFQGAYVAGRDAKSKTHYSESIGFRPGGVDYDDRDYVAELRRTHGTAISRVQVGRVTQVANIQIASPIIDTDGEEVGFTCTSVDLSQVARGIVPSMRHLVDGRLLVLDNEQRIVADSGEPDSVSLRKVGHVQLYRSTEEPMLRTGENHDGKAVHAAVLPVSVSSLGWTVVAMESANAIAEQVWQARFTALIVALVTLGLALVAAVALASLLARPLRALAQAAQSIGRGEDAPVPGAPRGPRELSQLSDAVAAMVRSLRRYAVGLEEQVQERTQQLSEANDQLVKALGELEEQQRLTQEDIAQARRFQEGLLPPEISSAAWDVVAEYRPLDGVGGDIYDVFELRPGTLRVFLADATGHGVQASMRTIMLKAEYDRLKFKSASTGELLAQLNNRIVDLFPEGDLHCAACCVDLERTSSGARFSFCSAAGAPLLRITPDGAEEIFACGPLLGVKHLSVWEEPLKGHLAEGELLIVPSDGLDEQFDEDRRRFDETLDLQALRPASTARAQLDELVFEFDAFRKNQPISDDVTIVVVRLKPS